MLTNPLQPALESAIGIDDRTQRFFEAYSGRAPLRLIDGLSKLGDQPEIRLVAGVLIAIGTFAPNSRLVRAGARMLIAHEAATLAKDLVKAQIDRTRPRSAKTRAGKKLKKGKHTAKEKTSFPSGHSGGAFAAARAFSREFPEYGMAAMGAAGLVSASQVVRCAHYPTDVAAGLAIGLAAEAATSAAWDAASMDERAAD